MSGEIWDFDLVHECSRCKKKMGKNQDTIQLHEEKYCTEQKQLKENAPKNKRKKKKS
jgi:hypothetical protein